MNQLFTKKIENIHKNLMECYRDTQHYAPTIIGTEREIFNRELLQRILPSNYRIGSGTIVDNRNHETGQIDAVIELPFSLSFPISSGQNRLYLADTVGAAFEIKSDLDRKWDEAIEKIIELKKLNRHQLSPNQAALLDNLKIPCFIVSFKGPKRVDTIFKKLEKIQMKDWPDGVYVIEHGTFYGKVPGGNRVYKVQDPKQAILAFIDCVYGVLKNYSTNVVDLSEYQKLFYYLSA